MLLGPWPRSSLRDPLRVPKQREQFWRLAMADEAPAADTHLLHAVGESGVLKVDSRMTHDWLHKGIVQSTNCLQKKLAVQGHKNGAHQHCKL